MIQYDSDRMRQRAENSPYTVAVDSKELLALLDDLKVYRETLERIVAWDYPCRDDGCEAGEVAARTLESTRGEGP